MRKTYITVQVVILLMMASAPAALVTDGLIIHLQADSITGLNDGDPVTAWADSSTADTVDGSVTVDAGLGSPTYETDEINGLPIVRFVRADADGMVSSLWDFPDPNEGMTVFIVCTGASGSNVHRLAQIGDAGGAVSRQIAVDVSENTSGCRYNDGYSLSYSGSNPISAGVYHIGIRQMAQGGRHDSLFYAVDDLDAEPLNCNNPENIITFNPSGNHISVGGGHDTNGDWWPDFYNGDVAEILVYNAQLSVAQMAETADYLSTKYGLYFGGDASIVVIPSNSDTLVTEDGVTDDIALSLTASPGSYPVTVQATDFLDPDQVTISPAELTFTAANWQTPQSFTVAAIDDAMMERAVHDTQLELAVMTDPASAYYGLPLNNVWVDIEDNDCGAWGFSPVDFNLDCVVDLVDFSMFAMDWVECDMPDPTCQPSGL